MKKLTKKYRLVANADKIIIIADQFNVGSETLTLQPYAFDYETEVEMQSKIEELELIQEDE